MKCPVVAALFLALTLASAPGAAQETETDTTQLETVVVSASKTPQPVTTLSQPVTVLLGEDLRARGVTRVSDALREVPGASLVQAGSYGSVTSLFLRGGESRYAKVMIDGVTVNASGGFFDFSHLTTDNIERIEIVRGPSSVLNGADAVTGTVHLFTKKGAGSPRLSLSARAGSHRSLDVIADASGAAGQAAYSFGAARHSTDGIHSFNNQYENGTLSSALRIGGGATGGAGISARYTTAEFHYPTDNLGQPVDSNAYRVQHRLTVGLDATRNLGAAFQGRFLAGSNNVADLTEDIGVPFGGTEPVHSAFRSRGYRRNAEGRLTFFAPGEAKVTVGMAYEREHESTTNNSGPVGGLSVQTDSFDASRRNTAYYSELLGTLWTRLSYTLAGRVDDNSDYDRFGTYRVGANMAATSGLRIRASLSTAFNAPAFNQLRPTLYTVGSPDLRPEKTRSAEIGIISRLSDVIEISGGVFNQRFAEMIQYIGGGAPDYKGSYANLTSAEANGYEVELHLTPSSQWRASGSYTVVNPRVVAVPGDYTGSERAGDALIRRPSHSGNVVASFSSTRGLGVSAAVTYVGKRPDTDFSQFPSPRVTLPSYVRADVSGQLPLMKATHGGLTLNARIENLFDVRYEDVLNFAAPGRAIFVGAKAVAVF